MIEKLVLKDMREWLISNPRATPEQLAARFNVSVAGIGRYTTSAGFVVAEIGDIKCYASLPDSEIGSVKDKLDPSFNEDRKIMELLQYGYNAPSICLHLNVAIDKVKKAANQLKQARENEYNQFKNNNTQSVNKYITEDQYTIDRSMDEEYLLKRRDKEHREVIDEFCTSSEYRIWEDRGVKRSDMVPSLGMIIRVPQIIVRALGDVFRYPKTGNEEVDTMNALFFLAANTEQFLLNNRYGWLVENMLYKGKKFGDKEK